jgi:hypothetical protein
MSRSYSYFSRLKGKPKRVKLRTAEKTQPSPRRQTVIPANDQFPVDPVPVLAAVGPTAEF